VRIKTFADLKAARKLTHQRFLQAKAARSRLIREQIAQTLESGTGDFSPILSQLSEQEKIELAENIPEIFENLKSAPGLASYQASNRAVGQLLRAREKVALRQMPVNDKDLARVARAVSLAPRNRVRSVIVDLKKLENPPDSFWRVFRIWLSIKSRSWNRKVRQLFK